MEDRPIQSMRRYLIALIIGTIIFVVGFLITYGVAYFEFSYITNTNDQTSYKIFEDKFTYRFFNENPCVFQNFEEISEDLGYQGVIISDLEDNFGRDNKNVLFRKKYYSLVELEHYEFVNVLNKECGLSIPTILFFYSNEKGDIDNSVETGKLLDYLSNRNNNLKIYSFDINLDSNLIRNLLEKYSVGVSPTIVVNGKEKIEGVFEVGEVEGMINEVEENGSGVIKL